MRSTKAAGLPTKVVQVSSELPGYKELQLNFPPVWLIPSPVVEIE